jgi:hypothetical protein
MEVDAAPEDDGRRERKCGPFPARELKPWDHGQGSERRSESEGDAQTTPKRGDGLVAVVMPARLVDRMRVISRCLDGGHEVVYGHRPVVVDGRLLGREVDGRLDAVELVELPLDPANARGARHALEVEPHLLPGLGLGRGGRARAHAAS